MTRETAIGRMVLCATFTALGLEPLLTGHLPTGLIPIPGLPGPLAILIGAGFALAAIASLFPERFPRAPLVLVACFGAALLYPHLPHLWSAPRDATGWAVVLEIVSLSAGALLLWQPSLRAARLMLAVALAGFGIQHFMFAQFISQLIPAWYPARLFLAWLTGAGFLATALALAAGRFERLAARLLALQFFIFVLTVHLPRIAAAPRADEEWSSGLIALAMAAIGLLLAGWEPELPSAFRTPPSTLPSQGRT